MRKIVQFQVISPSIAWALDDEGNLWERAWNYAKNEWRWDFIEGPPDGEPGGPQHRDWIDKLEHKIRGAASKNPDHS